MYVMFSDETPTPTQFLQNCDEVGLFKEIEEEFLQAQEEEKSKQVHFTEYSNKTFFCSLYLFIFGVYLGVCF